MPHLIISEEMGPARLSVLIVVLLHYLAPIVLKYCSTIER